MIVTPWVLALCVGFSLSQEVSANKEVIELDGKDGAGSSSVEYDNLKIIACRSIWSDLLVPLS